MTDKSIELLKGLCESQPHLKLELEVAIAHLETLEDLVQVLEERRNDLSGWASRSTKEDTALNIYEILLNMVYNHPSINDTTGNPAQQPG